MVNEMSIIKVELLLIKRTTFKVLRKMKSKNAKGNNEIASDLIKQERKQYGDGKKRLI